MRLKELHGLPVIDPTAARKVGTVVDYQVDPAAGRLAALDVTPVTGGDSERILAARIRRVGTSAVILTARGGSTPSTTAELNEHWLDMSTLVGLEVMGDDGNRIGQLEDATFDQDTLEIDAYSLGGSMFSLSGAPRRIQPDKVHSCSRELMMITSGHVETSAVEVAPTAAEQTAPLDMGMPLKEADRLPAPTYERVPDGHPVSASRR